MRQKSTIELNTTVERVEFELVLPDEINIKPWHSVELPRGRRADVYQTIVDKAEKRGGNNEGTTTRYDLYVVNIKTGKTSIESRYLNATASFWDIPALKQSIINTSAALAVKKRVNKSVDTDDTFDDE